jgi:hypothetical protein
MGSLFGFANRNFVSVHSLLHVVYGKCDFALTCDYALDSLCCQWSNLVLLRYGGTNKDFRNVLFVGPT